MTIGIIIAYFMPFVNTFSLNFKQSPAKLDAKWQKMCYNRNMMTMRIGPIIRSLREQRGMTQAELATKAGISQSYLSRAETSPRGDRIPTAILERIAAALGVTSTAVTSLVACYTVPNAMPPCPAGIVHSAPKLPMAIRATNGVTIFAPAKPTSNCVLALPVASRLISLRKLC
jgi:DNA-binding Xre family transcriptional regulator